MENLGMHYIAEYYGCPESYINNVDKIEEVMKQAALISKATIVKTMFHKFSPHGISGIIVVAESHFAIHTWPEHGYAAVDLFSCGEFNYNDALQYISSEIKAEKLSISVIERGILPDRQGNTVPLKLKEIVI